MLHLKTLGTPLLERDGRPLDGAARQRRVVALLVLVASGGERGISRDRLLALLWSESEAEKARQALTQSLYHARRALGEDGLFQGAADLRLNPDVIASDLGAFQNAISAGALERAVEAYTGPFLDGFHVSAAPEFERWVAEQRSKLHVECVRALETLSSRADEAGDLESAVRWRMRLAALEPLNSRVALGLMRAMAAVGDRAGAIRLAALHESLLRQELDAAPHPAIVEYASELRTTPSWLPPRASVDSDISIVRDEPITASSAAAANGVVDAGKPHERRTRRLRIAAAGLTAALVIAAGLWTWRATRDGRTGAPADLMVVAPFRVAGADPALAFLREGLVDLLASTFPGDAGARAADAGAVMSAWRRAGHASDADVPRSEALRIARQLGGTRLLSGSVVGLPSRLVVSASLFDVATGGLRAQVSVTGSSDSLATTVDRLVAGLLAKEAGEWERLAGSLTSSVPALRAYLDGQAAYRQGQYQRAVALYRRALDADGSFATAALALATAAERIDALDDRRRGLAVAWAARASLSERDSVFLMALAGPRYPDPSSPREQFTAWERALVVAPDRADVWHEVGERLFFEGRWLGIRDWSGRARAAFSRAAELDPSFASPLQYLVQLEAADGDTAAVRQHAAAYARIDSAGDLAPFVRWRAAVALRDSVGLTRLRRESSSTPTASLRAIAFSSLHNGIALDAADAAISALRRRAVQAAARADLATARHALSMIRGQLVPSRDALRSFDERPGSTTPLRVAVLDQLYAGLPSSDDLAAVQLAVHAGLDGGPSTPSATPADACVTEQWNAWRTIRPSPHVADAAPSANNIGAICSALVQAIRAVREGHPEAAAHVRGVDSLLMAAPSTDEERAYLPLAVARLHLATGDAREALSVIRRRPYMRGWPAYLADHLREEGNLARLVNDTASAISAYRHYLALRRAPQGPWRVESDSVRRELARLEAQ